MTHVQHGTLAHVWEQVVLSTSREFIMILDEQQSLLWCQAGRDEVANGFVEGLIDRSTSDSSGVLDLLLGNEQAQAALESVAANRDWQGSLTAQLQRHAGGGRSDSSSSRSSQPEDAHAAEAVAVEQSKGDGEGRGDHFLLSAEYLAHLQAEEQLQLEEGPQQPRPPSTGPDSRGSFQFAMTAPLPPRICARESRRGSLPGTAQPVPCLPAGGSRSQDSSTHGGRSPDGRPGSTGATTCAVRAKGSQALGVNAPPQRSQTWSLSQAAMERLRSSCMTNNNYNRTIAMLESVMEASTSTNTQQLAEGSSREQLCAVDADPLKFSGPSSLSAVNTLQPSQAAAVQSMRRSSSTSLLSDTAPQPQCGARARPPHLSVQWEDEPQSCAKSVSLPPLGPSHTLGASRSTCSSVRSHARSSGSVSSGRPGPKRHHSASTLGPGTHAESLSSHPAPPGTPAQAMRTLDKRRQSGSTFPDALTSLSCSRLCISSADSSPHTSCYASPCSSFPASPMDSVRTDAQATVTDSPACQLSGNDALPQRASDCPTGAAPAAAAIGPAWALSLCGGPGSARGLDPQPPGRCTRMPSSVDMSLVSVLSSVSEELMAGGSHHAPQAAQEQAFLLEPGSSTEVEEPIGPTSTASLTFVPLTLSMQQQQQQQQQQQPEQGQLPPGLALLPSGPEGKPLPTPGLDGLQAVMDAADGDEEGAGKLPQVDCIHTCFEVCVKPATLPGGRRAVVVSVEDNTEQIQIHAALSELAEAQLALLAGIMPHHALQFLAMESTAAVPRNAAALAREHKGCTIMFMDIVGFTSMCKMVPPQDVLFFLNNLFSICDGLTDKHGVHKVETAGDCYIVSGGILASHPTSGFLCTLEEIGVQESPQVWARQVHAFAKDLLLEARKVSMPHTGEPVDVRIGIHSGDVVSGLIGTKLPKFSLFGDTMNTSARMESTGVPGRIHVSAAAHALLESVEEGSWEPTGGVQVKGKGFMQTYLWVPPDSPPLCPRASVSPLVIPEHSVEARSRRPSLHSSPAATNPSTQAQKPAADDAAQPPQPHGALPDVPWSLGCLPGAQATAAFGGQTAVAAAARKVAGPPSWTYRAPKAAQASLRTSVSVTAAGTGDEGDAGAGEAGSAAAPLPLPRRSMGHRPAGVALSASTLLSYSSSQTRGHSARVRDALAGSVTSYRSSLRYSRQCGSGREQRSSVGPRAGSYSVWPAGRDQGVSPRPRPCRSAHVSLDRHTLQTRFLSQMERRGNAPSPDLQHIMESFSEFNHLAVLGGLGEYGPSGGFEPQGSRGDPLQVILRALPVQGMQASFLQPPTPTQSLMSPSSKAAPAAQAPKAPQ